MRAQNRKFIAAHLICYLSFNASSERRRARPVECEGKIQLSPNIFLALSHQADSTGGLLGVKSTSSQWNKGKIGPDDCPRGQSASRPFQIHENKLRFRCRCVDEIADIAFRCVAYHVDWKGAFSSAPIRDRLVGIGIDDRD